MKKQVILVICLFFSVSFLAQNMGKRNFKIMCYNVENYFDCVDDSLTDDSEYLPGGLRGWNVTKYQKKQTNIGRVITAIGGWDAPALVGLCEVESEKCLTDLTRYSGLKSLKYKFLHHESPDARGIDVALLYQPKQFKPIHNEAIGIYFPFAPASKTRDILFASGIVPTGDTLHVFVCHFPSRLGGELESDEKRMFVAQVLRAKVDSLFAVTSLPNIVIMGDFNDFPINKSLLETLKALPTDDSVSNRQLYNMMYWLHKKGVGTNKHQGEWGALDQMILSGNLLNKQKLFCTSQEDVHVFDAAFLLEDDYHFLGKQPFRTYTGMKYQDGFSDHLPVYTDFWYQLLKQNNMEIQLFIPCYIDQLYPQTAFNTIKVLERAGCKVHYNPDQTCCGQPAFNSGHWNEATVLAEKFVTDFNADMPVVSPSGSCSSFVIHHYHKLLKDKPDLLKKQTLVKEKIFELSDFLVNILKVEKLNSKFPHKVTFHDSCSALREYGLRDEARRLLSNVEGLELIEMEENDTCCGFGGTFAVKNNAISSAMAEKKVRNALETGAEFIVSTEASCLMNINGYCKKHNIPIKGIHLADILAEGF